MQSRESVRFCWKCANDDFDRNFFLTHVLFLFDELFLIYTMDEWISTPIRINAYTKIASDPDQIKKMFDEAVEAFGTVDVLINNAGITRDGLVMRMKPDQWQAVIDTNLSGVFYCTQAFFKLAAKKRTGRIINISSVVGQIGNPGQANYAAAKGGVIGMSMSNAKEFAARGVVVNTVCPGFIETDMTDELPAEYLEKVSEGIPLKRLGKPEEVSSMCKFLALDPAVNYITGHTFNVDGGIAMGC